MLAVFITGTDTGVGKTTVSAALLAAANARKLRTLAMKPIESGCQRTREGLLPVDAHRLATLASIPVPLEEVCPYRLELPVAPAVAAKASGTRIALQHIEHRYAALANRAPDVFIIEGAGGLLVPINEEHTIADLASHLSLPLVVVARDSLGTINHTLLTVTSARARGLRVAGVVLCSTTASPSARDQDNAPQIATHGGIRILGSMPHLEHHSLRDVTSLADAGDAILTELLLLPDAEPRK